MINYKYKDLFLKSHIDKQLKIAADDGSFTATNTDINFENFELTESLCSDSELRFGSCEASMVKFQIRNAFIPLAGKWMTVTETLDGNADAPFQYGHYKVFSDKPTADREYRDIVAYDAMYDILGADVTAWYNTILPNKDSTVTLKQFRESFIRHFGLTEVLPKIGEGNAGNPVYGLVNDTMTVERTIEPDQISGKDVITAICEINGCFGHIGRDGKFHYIYLPQAIEGLYPANDLYPDHAPEDMAQARTGHLYPQDPKGTNFGIGKYIKCKYEDYTAKPITKLQIRQEENDIGAVWPNEENSETDNCYIIESNFLVYGKTSDDLSLIAQNIFGKITEIAYRPFEATCVGNPCMEVRDPVRFVTKYKLVESYILNRTIKGIQSLRDNYKADGTEKYAEKLNGLQKSIMQLKGKTNSLTRTVEKTRLEMKDMESDMSSEIEATANEIRLEVSQGYETKENAQDNYDFLSGSITVNADNIALKVSKGNVSSEISAEAGAVAIKSNRLTVEAQNFNLSGSGAVSARGEIETVAENGVSAKLKGNGLSIQDTIGVEVGKYTATYNASTPNDYSKHGMAVVTSTGNVGIGVDAGTKANIYYYMNNGANPSGLTERHLFNQEARFINAVKAPSLLFANSSASYGRFSGGTYDGKVSAYCEGGFYANGSIGCSGTKHRIVDTKNYGTVGMNAFETAGAYFSDIGSGHVESNKCYIYLDPVFLEVIDQNEEYQVLITRTSLQETSWVEKHEYYFIVHGKTGASFDWMVIAKQKGYQTDRMESAIIDADVEIPYDESIFYGDDAPQALSERYMYELEDTIEEDAMQYIRDFVDMENEIIEGVN